MTMSSDERCLLWDIISNALFECSLDRESVSTKYKFVVMSGRVAAVVSL